MFIITVAVCACGRGTSGIKQFVIHCYLKHLVNYSVHNFRRSLFLQFLWCSRPIGIVCVCREASFQQTDHSEERQEMAQDVTGRIGSVHDMYYMQRIVRNNTFEWVES